jgi:hydrogenase expression/formation protein HypC
MCLAVPGRVERVFEEGGVCMGKVSFGGVIKDVCMVYLPDVRVGDYVIVHVGFALSKLDEASAQASLRTFAELDLLDAELDELRATDLNSSPPPSH